MNIISRFINNIINRSNNPDSIDEEEHFERTSEDGIYVYFDAEERKIIDTCTEEINQDCKNCKFLSETIKTNQKSYKGKIFNYILFKGVVECPICHRRYFITVKQNNKIGESV